MTSPVEFRTHQTEAARPAAWLRRIIAPPTGGGRPKARPRLALLGAAVVFLFVASRCIVMASPDGISVVVDQSITFDPTENDTLSGCAKTDLGGAPRAKFFSLSVDYPPTNGTTTIATGGEQGDDTTRDAIRYTPVASYEGDDSFSYTFTCTDFKNNSVSDSSSVMVSAVPDELRATNDEFSMTADGSLSMPPGTLLRNDLPAGIAPDAILRDTYPAHGMVDLSDDGRFVYTPDKGFVGADSFGYSFTYAPGYKSGFYSNHAMVTIHVAADFSPEAEDDAFALVGGEHVRTMPAPGVLQTTRRQMRLGWPIAIDSPAHGTVTLNEDGSFTYTAADGFTGADTFGD